MNLFVNVMGEKLVATKMETLGRRRANMEPVMAAVALKIFEIEDKIFESQGRRGGGSWKADSPDWLARKIRDGLDPRIGHATGELRDSMTEPDAPGQAVHVGRNYVSVGSRLPQAAPSQRNRPFANFMRRDAVAIREIVRKGMFAAWGRRR